MGSLKGVPANLRPLAATGDRVRFNGFWLNEKDRDRVIAHWIDETPAASTVIKHLLYMYITGQGQVMPSAQQMGAFEIDEDDEMINALLSFED